MARVWIPSLMRDLTAGDASVVVAGATVREVIANLERAYPGCQARLLQPDGEVQAHIAVAVDGEVPVMGLQAKVGQNSEVHFIPPMSGG